MRKGTMKGSRGFTLVEVLVGVSIIITIVSVTYGALGGARDKARDQMRIADLEQLRLAIRLSADKHGDYPSCNGGYRLGTGAVGGCADAADIATDFATFFETPPVDPTDDNRHYYQYETGVNCNGSGQTVVFAKNLEEPSGSNYSTVCTCGASCGFTDGRPENGYIIVIEE